MSFRILHIEDDPLQIQLVRTFLYRKNVEDSFIYETCTSLEEAKLRLDLESFDIILLDLALPDSEGITSITAVRAFCSNTPIVVLTATEDIKTAKASIHAGASSYVLKSDISALPLILILTVEKWRMEQALANRCVLYDSIVNLSPDYICRFNPDYLITFANNAFCLLLLQPMKNVLGTSICDYLPDEVHERIAAYPRLTDSFCLLTEESEFKVNGRWVSWRASAIRDRTGKIIEIQCVGRDTTLVHQQTQLLLETARNRMCEQQLELNANVDRAFTTLMETDKLLSQMEGGVGNGRR